jgi:hypothetical protein
MDPIPLMRAALTGTGLDLFASCPIEGYDARAPAAHASARLMPRARGLVVVASAGRALWDAARARFGAAWSQVADPIDSHVARALDVADLALARAGIGSRRFEPHAATQLDFRTLGEIVGLGSFGPFGMLIHSEHGPWWALRAAYFVDTEVAPALAHRPPCEGCAAPCIDGIDPEPVTGVRVASHALLTATPAARDCCIVGRASRYANEQIAHHALMTEAHVRAAQRELANAPLRRA